MSRLLKICVTLSGAGAVAFVLGITLMGFLPSFVQKMITTTLSEHNLPISLQVRDIGFWSSDFSEIAVGAVSPFARIDSVRVDYSPVGLWQKRLSKVSLSGLELNLQIQDGKLVLPWQPAENATPPDPLSDRNTTYHLEYLQHLGTVSIDHARINLSFNDRMIALPCSLALRTSDANPQVIDIQAELTLRGQQITTTAAIDLETMELRTDMSTDSFDLIRFADLIPISDAPAASGTFELQAKAHLVLQPFAFLSAQISGKLVQAAFSLGEMRITTLKSPEEQPFLFNLTADKEKGRFTTTSLAVEGPITAQAGAVNLSLSQSETGISFNGDFLMEIPEQKTAAALSLSPIKLVTEVHGGADKDGGWQCTAQASQKQPLTLSQGNLTLTTQITDYALTASGKADQTSLTYNVDLAPLTVTADAFHIQLPKLSASGETLNGKSSFVVPFEDFQFTDNGDFSAKAGGKILFSWPYRPESPKSTITLDALQFADLPLGSLSLTLQQEERGLKFEGRHQSALLDSLCIDLTGQAVLSASGPAAAIQFHSACKNSFQNINLGKFTPTASGFSADAALTLDGNILYEKGRFSGQFDSQIENIRLRSQKNDFTLEGGSLAIQLAELPKLKSGPQQKLSFQSLKFGKITASNGLIVFQIESPDSIFIEKSQVEWSQGHVYTQALRFSPKIKDYDLIFYCDRLNFAQLLEQLGAAAGEGQGRVNGRVPVRITNGNFFLENGFLYSTPGEGGTIALTKTALLTEGIPRDTPQFAQIDLAREALKDFSYDWTKLDLQSESEEDLLLHLQINGKPAKPLPFVYSQEFGGFARVDASSPGSRFQGIKLDVNFRLPLNQILHYGESIKSLMR